VLLHVLHVWDSSSSARCFVERVYNTFERLMAISAAADIQLRGALVMERSSDAEAPAVTQAAPARPLYG